MRAAYLTLKEFAAMPTTAELMTLLQEVFREQLSHRSLPDTDAPLFGEHGALDSMDLVTYAAEVEDAVGIRYGRNIVIADAKALSRGKSPFRTLTALADYCLEQMNAA